MIKRYQLAAIAASQIVHLRKMYDDGEIRTATFTAYLRRLAELSAKRCIDAGIRAEAEHLIIWSLAIELADERQREEVIA